MARKFSDRALKIIHTAIMQSGDQSLIDAYAIELTTRAMIELDMLPKEALQRRCESMVLNDAVLAKLNQQGLRRDWLLERGEIILDAIPVSINLSKLASRIPAELALEHIDPCEWRSQLKAERGGDLDQRIKEAFVTTVGKPGIKGGFAIVLKKDALTTALQEKIYISHVDPAINRSDIENYKLPIYSPETGEVIETPISNIPEDQKSRRLKDWINLTSKLKDKEIDPASVVLLRPEYHKMAAHIIADVIEFQGASHYLLGKSVGR